MYKLPPVCNPVSPVYNNIMYKHPTVVPREPETCLKSAACDDAMSRVKVALYSHIQNAAPPTGDLKNRQERLLTRLESLQEHMTKLLQKLSSPGVKSRKVNLPNDIVVNANPEQVPFSLLHLQRTLGLHINCYTHSSISKLQPAAQLFNNEVASRNIKNYNLKISLIWKNVPSGLELIVSPTSRVVILGEVNVLRYLLLAIPSQYSYDNTDSSWETDNILDTCNRLQNMKSGKDRDIALKALSTKLGQGEWFLGKSSPGVADILMFSTVKQLQVEKSLLPNLKTLCSKFSKINLG